MNSTSTLKRIVMAVTTMIVGMAMLSPGTPAYAAGSRISASSTAGSSSPVGGLGPCDVLAICLQAATDSGPVSAWSWLDVGPTPYYISIFNRTTGQRVALCGFGRSCTTDSVAPPLGRCYDFVAFVGGFGSTIPPAPVRSTSNIETLCSFLH